MSTYDTYALVDGGFTNHYYPAPFEFMNSAPHRSQTPQLTSQLLEARGSPKYTKVTSRDGDLALGHQAYLGANLAEAGVIENRYFREILSPPRGTYRRRVRLGSAQTAGDMLFHSGGRGMFIYIATTGRSALQEEVPM